MNIFTKDPSSPDVIESLKKEGHIVVEVTIKRLYILHDQGNLPELMKEWFVAYRGRSHAYRDGSVVGGTDQVQEIKNLTTGKTIELS